MRPACSFSATHLPVLCCPLCKRPSTLPEALSCAVFNPSEVNKSWKELIDSEKVRWHLGTSVGEDGLRGALIEIVSGSGKGMNGPSLSIAGVNDSTRYLTEQAAKATGAQAELWQQLQRHYSNRLWYQYAEVVKKALADEHFLKQIDALQFYRHCLDPIQDRINAVLFAQFATILYKRIARHEEARAFLNEVEKVVNATPAATCLVRSALLQLMLTDRDAQKRVKNIDQIRTERDKLAQEVDRLPGVTAAHAPFYSASSNYYREVGEYSSYYVETLRYLGCVEYDSITPEERLHLAKCMAVAALLANDIYNFGELLAHPIVNALDNNENRWLLKFLRAFNAGDFALYAELKPRVFAAYPDLKSQEKRLVEKIQMLAIVELAFERGASTRSLKFEEIAERCQIDIDAAEQVCMRCMARKLVRGSIDGVNKLFRVTWTQPRVLDSNQIRKLAARIDQWSKDVLEASKVVEKNASEIIVKNG